MKNKTDDLRIINTQELISPQEIINTISPTDKGLSTIINAREEIKNFNRDIRKFAIAVGPCSIHDVMLPKSTQPDLKLSDRLSNNCLIIMRVYFEKTKELQ